MAIEFLKAINSNPTIEAALDTTIVEYDIKAAHPTALYFIEGKAVYDKLMAMDKLKRNITIGKMIRDNHSLSKKIDKLILSWMNQFLDVNNIKHENFVESTKDSIMIIGKLAKTTKFGNGMVVFRNKDGQYTSLFRVDSDKRKMLFLYDNFRNYVKVKGINDEIVDTSPFIDKFLKNMIRNCETRSIGRINAMGVLSEYRKKYMNNRNPEIFQSLLHDNHFLYNSIGGELVETDSFMGMDNLDIGSNYVNVIAPIMRSVFTHRWG